MKVHNLYIGTYVVHSPNEKFVCYKCPEKAIEKACICLEDSEAEMYLDYCKQHKEDVLDDAANELEDEPATFFGEDSED